MRRLGFEYLKYLDKTPLGSKDPPPELLSAEKAGGGAAKPTGKEAERPGG